jgi:hypothetical protein
MIRQIELIGALGVEVPEPGSFSGRSSGPFGPPSPALDGISDALSAAQMGALNVPVTWSEPPASQRLPNAGFVAKVRSKRPEIAVALTSVITTDPVVASSLTASLQFASRAM